MPIFFLRLSYLSYMETRVRKQATVTSDHLFISWIMTSPSQLWHKSKDKFDIFGRKTNKIEGEDNN